MLGNLLSGGISGVLKGTKDLISQFHMDPVKQAELEIKLLQVQHEMEKAQIDVNIQEAKHPDWKVAGWRPATGWICAAGLGYQALLQPILAWAATLASMPVPPPVDTALLTTVLLGMLGLGGIRAFERVKKVARGQ